MLSPNATFQLKDWCQKWSHACDCIQLNCQLEHALLSIKVLALRTSCTKVSTPSNNYVLLEQKVVLITTRCFVKNVSQYACSQYWGYTIPRAYMTPWVGNLVSNSSTNVFAAPAKASTLHNYPRQPNLQSCFRQPLQKCEDKTKINKLKNKIKQAKRDSFKNLPLHWFFTNDFTTTNINSMTNIGVIVSKSQCTTHMCWPFISKAKCWSPKLRSSIHFMWMFSCLHSSKDLNTQKVFVMKLKLCSKYMLYKSPWQTLIVTIRSHTNTSRICANLIKACTDFSSGRIQASPNQI